MTLPKDYYEAEVRDGFYVPSEMKRCWAATIGVLQVIDDICKRYGLQYYAEYGTLLGAVRHGGFVPWDDDFDISMKREDYLRFLKVAERELPQGYVLLSAYNNHEYNNFLSRVVNSNFISLEKEFLESNHNFPFAVGVDIFPLDYFDYEEKENGILKDMILSAQAIIAVLDPEETDIESLGETAKAHIMNFCELCGMPLLEGKPIRQQIYIMIERFCAIYDSSAPYLTNMYFWVKNGNQVYKKEYFENTVRIPFEFSEICAPVGYDEKLLNCYGPNYMTPYMGGGLHDYPLYGKQKEVMIETTGRSYYKQYSFEEKDLERPVIDPPQRSVREIVFLPFKAKYWPFMEKEWERAQSEEDTQVFVIPIPYYEKGLFGLTGDIHYEADSFPDYVPITPFDQYDFDKRIPDRIVIQNPFDDFDSAITVHPRFYSDVLISETRELVYIPYFTVDDSKLDGEKTAYTADFFVKTPGVVRSDRIYLQSEGVRSLYINKLCEMAGEDTRSLWEQKTEVREYIKPEISEGIREEDIPQDWWKYLLDDNNEGKKVILFHTSISDMVTLKEKYFEKLDSVLEIFAAHSNEMTIIWQAHPGTQEMLEVKYPDLWDMYKKALNRFLAEDYGIYDDREDHSRAVAISDAYYGDRDAIMHDFMQTGRPVMIMNAQVI